MKIWAVSNQIDLTIFTEIGHGKGPMDGVGGGIKRVITKIVVSIIILRYSYIINH